MSKRPNEAVQTSSSKRGAAWWAAHSTQLLLLDLCSKVPQGDNWQDSYRTLIGDLLNNGASFSRRFEDLSPLEHAMEVRNGGPFRIFLTSLMVDLHPRPDEKLVDHSMEILLKQVGQKYPAVHAWDPEHAATTFRDGWDVRVACLFIRYLHAITQGVLDEILSVRDWFSLVEPHIRHPPQELEDRQHLSSSIQTVLGLRLV
jgi:hypothetical protein